MLRLSMHVHQPAPELRERAQRHRAPVHPSHGATFRCDLTREHQRVIWLDAELVQEGSGRPRGLARETALT